MTRTLAACLVAVVLALVAPVPANAADAVTAPGPPALALPRLVCFGDSITKGGYPQAIDAKALGVEVVNAGVGGNTTAQGLKRMQADVLDRKPGVVVVLFGTNDCRLDEPKVAVPLATYEANLKKIVDQCRKAGATVVLCTPPPIDAGPYFKRHKKEPFDEAGGLEKVLDDYRAAARRVAEATKAPLVDLNQLLAKEKPDEWRSPDGVHPTPKGYALIAKHVSAAVRPLLPH
jgi:lysophospholipase L1-like esterase